MNLKLKLPEIKKQRAWRWIRV